MTKKNLSDLINATASAPVLLDDDFLQIDGNGSCGLTTCGKTCAKTCDVTCNHTMPGTVSDPEVN